MSSSPDTTLAVPVKFCSSCRTSRPVETFCGAIRLLYMSSITTGLATNLNRAQARRRANGAGARSASPGKRSKSRLRTSRSPPFRPALSFLCSDFLCSGFFARLSLGYLHSISFHSVYVPRCYFLCCLAVSSSAASLCVDITEQCCRPRTQRFAKNSQLRPLSCRAKLG